MEELDLLKKDWKKNENFFPKISEKDIYAMLHKKSSSIVRWILIISILEFALYLSLSLFVSDSHATQGIQSYTPKYLSIFMDVVGYGIIVYFIYQFYKSYRKITATDNTKKLMKTILHTRKTVSNYIIANIAYMIVIMMSFFILVFNNDPGWLNFVHETEVKGTVTLAYILFFVGAAVGIAFFACVFWLIYKVIYGFLVKRLYKNYKELEKIDF